MKPSAPESLEAPALLTPAGVDRELRIAPEDLYWAILDPAPLGKQSIEPAERGYLLEAEVPVALEDLHVAYAPLGDGRVLACAIERARLADLAEGDALSAVPDSLPEWIPADVTNQVDVASLELLDGDFEPAACRRARQRCILVAAASLALAIGILAVGVVAESRAIDRAIAACDERSEQLTRAALAGAPRRDGLPDALRLEAERRELRGTRSGDAPAHNDVSPILALALRAWPEGTRTHLDSVGVTAESISLRGQARSAEDYQRVIDGLSALPGWRIGSPQFREAKDGYAFTAELAPGITSKDAPQAGGAP